MSDSFYRAFEDRHRGSRELIKSRLTAYLPFLVPMTASRTPAAIDLGCGRGEWLELLGETGFSARGVDLDEGMLAACRERGLNVETQDALACLRAQPDASLALVSAFHLVEHIPFDAVQELVREALRVLEPGGLLIMETPNPENLVVATSGFYMDPSHLRPIPPLLLEFVVEFGGFVRHRVVRLQESPQLHGGAPLELMNVLNGASPDYSVVAQKGAELTVTAPFDTAFSATYGLDLATLAQRYQTQQDSLHRETDTTLVQLTERIAAAEVSAGGLFQRTLETISEAQAAAKLIQAELYSAQQRERALEATAHAQALREAEARAASYLSQAQEAGARALHADQRALEAEHLAAENAALAERRADEVRQLIEEQARQAEAMARHFEQQSEQKIAESARQSERRVQEVQQHVERRAERRLQDALQVQEQTSAQLRQMEQQFEELKRYADNSAQAHHVADAHAQHLQWQLNEMTVRLMASEQQVRDMLASSSWRMTRPARAAKSLFVRRPLASADVERMVAARNKAGVANLIKPLVRNLVQRPAVRTFALRALVHFPGVEKRLRSIAHRSREAAAPALVAPSLMPATEAPAQGAPAPVSPPPGMSRSAQNIFAQLQRRLHSDDHREN
jgi:O-antigen chain-terminating methyltransferase